MNFEIVIGSLSKVTVWLLLVWAATYLLRHRTAALRHMLWATGLTGALLLPVLELVPGWQVLPWPEAAVEVAVPATVTGPADMPGTPAPIAASEATEIGGETGAVEESATTSAIAARPQPTPDESQPTPVEREAAPAAIGPIPWGTVLLGAWALGAAFLLTRLLHGFHTVRQIARRAGLVESGPMRDALDRALASLQVRRRVQLRAGGGVAGPMTWGLLRPVVVLPEEAEAWSMSRLRAVLHHEVAHVARRDCLVQLVARLVRCAYWFHPFVWVASRGLHLEQERACDDVVLRAGVPASAYAEDLMCIARDLRPMPSVAMVSTAIARPSELMGRMHYLLDGGQVRRRTSRRLRLGLVGGAMLLSAALGVARPVTDAPVEPQGQQDKQDKEHPLAARLVGLLDLESHRAQAITELVQIGAPALPSLQRALKNQRADVSKAAVVVLSQMVSKVAAAAPVLISALDHPQVEVRDMAAAAIRSIGPEATAALARLQKTRGQSAKLSQALVATLVPRPAPPKPSQTGPRPSRAKVRPVPTLMLIADYSENRIIELDGQGREVFSIDEVFGVWDVEPLANGNLLITEFSVNRVSEITRKNKVVWQFDDLKNPYDADRLPNGNTLIADTFGMRVIEVDQAGKIVWRHEGIRPYDVERLANGNTLIADATGKRVIEVDKQGRTVWQVKNLPNVQDVDRLPNGNTLVTVRTRNEVLEIDPKGNTVWRLGDLKSPSDADRLPNGTTIVAENGAVRMFSSDKREVWRKPVTWAVEVNVHRGMRQPRSAVDVGRRVSDLLAAIHGGSKQAVAHLGAMRTSAFPFLLARLPSARAGREYSAVMQVLLEGATSDQAVAITRKLLERLRSLPAAKRRLSIRHLTACMSEHRAPLDLVLLACSQSFPGREECYRALPRIVKNWDYAADVLIARLPKVADDHAKMLVEVLGARHKPSAKVVDALIATAVQHRSEPVALEALTSLMGRGIYRKDIARQLNKRSDREDPALVGAQQRYVDEILFAPDQYVPPSILVADYSDNRIVEFDAEGKESFKIENIFGVWDVEHLANGNLLVTEFSVNRVSEMTRKREVIWEFKDLKNPYDADRLPNGNTLIADTFGRRVIEVDKAGKIVWKYDKGIHPYDADRLPNGNTLIADTHDDRVIEVDRAGEIVWQVKNVPNVHDADRLPNGNTLLTIRMLNEVREVTPGGKTVMRLRNLSSPSDADRLADGTTIVAENGYVRIFSPGGRELYRKPVTWAVEVNAR